MNIKVNTDSSVESSDRFIDYVKSETQSRFEPFQDKITTVNVFFKDKNSNKSGKDDKECTVEARPAGLNPLSASHSSDTVDDALSGALDKSWRRIRDTLSQQ